MGRIASRRSRLVSAVLLATVAAGACGGGGGSGGGAGGAPRTGGSRAVELKVGGVYSPAATLRAELTRLLQEHVFLSGTAAVQVLQGGDPAPTAAVLDANTAALGATIGRVYDAAAAERFLELWRRKTALVLEFAQAAAVGDEAAQARVKADLAAFKEEFGAFVNGTNPQLPAEDTGEDAGTHVNTLLAAVTAHAKNDPLALAKLRDAAEVMPRTSAIFAAGIVKQMPKAFEGSPDGWGATLLATLTAAFQEHVYLLAADTRTVVAGGDDKKQRETLDETAEGLANLVGSVYGDPASRRFLRVWRGHIGSFVAYAEAAAAKDAAAMQQAASDLAAFRSRLGAFLDSVNPYLPREGVAANFEDYVSAMSAVIDAQAAGDPAEAQRVHEAAATTPLLAELLGGAIARQFEDKFS